MCQAMWSKAITCDRQCGARPVHVSGNVEQGQYTCQAMWSKASTYDSQRGARPVLVTDNVGKAGTCGRPMPVHVTGNV